MPKYIHAGLGEGVMRKWLLFRNHKIMWQMMRDVFKGHYRLSLLTILIIILEIIYVISPIDLIPDHYFLIGWLDDALIFFLTLKRIQFETHRYIRFKVAERRRGGSN